MATTKRGGPRIGAGRPALPPGEKKILVAFRLSPSVVDYLRKTDHVGGMTGLIEDLILKHAKKQKTNKVGNDK